MHKNIVSIFFVAFMGLGLFTGCHLVTAQDKHQLPKLEYGFDALEPSIDSTTMNIHYSRHHAGYVNNLNKLIKGTPAENLSLEKLLATISAYPEGVRNNAGGHYNHTLFWTILTPKKNTQPSKRLAAAINAQYGSLDSLKIALTQAAANTFGSGWAWLSVDKNNKLVVTSTRNQDNPLMDVVEQKGTPVLGIDVWEHAYYLKYQNKRADYLKYIWDVINWEEVSKRYEAIVKK
jgi:Fe-Mn family superoxide dismutase